VTAERDDDRLPDSWLAAAREHHRPPDVPRAEMWDVIAAERERRTAARRNLRRLRWGLALAATLVLGIGIGRMGWLAGARPAAAMAPAPGTAYRVVAAQYLVRTEALLTDFHAASRGGRLDPQFVGAARDLLTTTRLMLDSPAADDPHLATLLQDLELVLAQIAQLPDEPARQDEMNLINQDLTQRSVLSRLRAATPAPGAPARIQGAL